MMFIGLGVFVLLFYVSTYGDYSAGGYGAAIRFEQLFLLPVLGLNASTLALVGQNFGAMNFSRIHETYNRSIFYGTFFMAVCGLFISFYQTTSCTFLAIVKKLFFMDQPT